MEHSRPLERSNRVIITYFPDGNCILKIRDCKWVELPTFKLKFSMSPIEVIFIQWTVASMEKNKSFTSIISTDNVTGDETCVSRLVVHWQYLDEVWWTYWLGHRCSGKIIWWLKQYIELPSFNEKFRCFEFSQKIVDFESNRIHVDSSTLKL